MIKKLEEFIPDPRTGDRALDIGAGEGKDSFLLAKMGYTVDAVDSKEPSPSNRINWHTLPVQEFIMTSNTYTVIIAMNVLQFLEGDLGSTISRINDGLAPKGVFICRVPIKFRSAIRNFDLKLTSEKLKQLFSLFEKKHFEAYWSDDAPHPGADFPHQHFLIDFVGTKS